MLGKKYLKKKTTTYEHENEHNVYESTKRVAKNMKQRAWIEGKRQKRGKKWHKDKKLHKETQKEHRQNRCTRRKRCIRKVDIGD